MNTQRKLLALAFLASMSESFAPQDHNHIPQASPEPKEPVIPKGCKEYFFGEFKCVAINEKSAEKKYKKWQLANQ